MSLEDYEREIYRCGKCAVCTQDWQTFRSMCPAGERFGFQSYFLNGRVEIARGLLADILDKNSEKLSEIIYTCTECKACQDQCHNVTGMDLLDCTREVKSLLIEEGSTPSEVRDFLENVQKVGNPYGESRSSRDEWMDGLEIEDFDDGNEFLYYVGCVGSYDTRSQDAAKALGKVLLNADVSFGVLGREENCDGNEVNMLGERGLFEMLIEENAEEFKERGVEKIITLSPHAFNSFKNEYPDFFEVSHYTQVLEELIEEEDLDLSSGFDGKVSYHDPCFLGRYNDVYDVPRKVLESVPGVELVEMDKNKEESFCCGGGGGNFYTDFLGTKDITPARLRVREAFDTGADTLAVACPTCLTMLNDAVKDEGLEEDLSVLDISEIIERALA